MVERINGNVRVVGPMRKQLIGRWLAVLTVVAAACVGVWQYLLLPTRLEVAVGPAGSEREIFLRSVAEALAKRTSIRLKVRTVSDSSEAARLLESNVVDLAVVRSDESQLSGARTFAILDRRAVILVLRAEPKSRASTAPTESDDVVEPAVPPSRLAGKRIVVGSDALGSNLPLARRLLAHAGLDDSTIMLRELPSASVAGALARSEADAAVLVVDPTAASTRALVREITAAVPRTVALAAPPAAEGLPAVYREVASITLASGQLGGPELLPANKLVTVAITDELVGDGDLTEASGALLFRSLMEVRGLLPAMQSAYEIEPPPSDRLRRYLPHAGVVAGDKATSFLETYSDQIWLGLFALGLLGSSLAGFAGWLGLSRTEDGPESEEVQHLVASLEKASSVEEVEYLRRQLWVIASERLRRHIAGSNATSSAAHPSHWYPIVDALAVRRHQELSAGVDAKADVQSRQA